MTSNIRIVQSALRASRKNKKEVNKITKIILPILNKNDWLENNENSDLKKVKEVIYQMGLEDETITQKIKVYKIEIKKQELDLIGKKNTNNIDDFGEYIEELDHVMIDGDKFATIIHAYPDDNTFEVEIIYFAENVVETVTKDRITMMIKKHEK